MVKSGDKYLVSLLALKMKDKKIKNLTELAILTGYDQGVLERILYSEIDLSDFDVIDGLRSFFKCRMSNLVETREEFKDYSSWVDHKEKHNGIVYFARNDEGLTKIGWTQNFKKRKEALKLQEKINLELVHYISTYDCPTLEKTLHNVFKHKRVRGEWFDLSEEDIALIKS